MSESMSESPVLEDVEGRVVDLWGTMSSLWGVNPTMARIHGLLFITGAPLSMNEIMDRLAISRGNVSMNLTKLIEWGLVQRMRPRGNRQEHYASLTDVWEMFTRIAAQRKRREIDPVLSTLRQCRDDLAANTDEPGSDLRLKRIEDLLAFLTLMDHLAQHFFASHKDLRAAVELLTKTAN